MRCLVPMYFRYGEAMCLSWYANGPNKPAVYLDHNFSSFLFYILLDFPVFSFCHNS